MKKILITGGAGFIGSHATIYFASKGWQVSVLDNLSRVGAEKNLEWIKEQADIDHYLLDLRDETGVKNLIKSLKPDVICHLAAQVAVTFSVQNPREDFSINALGTFNLLEAVRLYSPNTFFINASTNKVYGKMEDLEITEFGGAYKYKNFDDGISESRPLDFHSPYGCSKGIAEQYVLDYSRIYGIKTCSFRQSCIYGTRQFGIEDQGWVAWFAIAALTGRKIKIFGTGKQSRDLLHVSDLIAAYEKATLYPEKCNGQAFNIGGGPSNVLSLLELINFLEIEIGDEISIDIKDLRPGDQPVYISNTKKLSDYFDWKPKVKLNDGLLELIGWIRSNESLFHPKH